jgi:hypothetical protein
MDMTAIRELATAISQRSRKYRDHRLAALATQLVMETYRLQHAVSREIAREYTRGLEDGGRLARLAS